MNRDHFGHTDLDHLTYIATQEQSDAWVNRVLDLDVDPADIAKVYDLFMGKSRFHVQESQPYLKGGAPPKEADYRLHRLMELADSIHDCDDEDAWEDIRESLGAELPWIYAFVDKSRIPPAHLAKAKDYAIKKTNLTDIASWERFKYFMTTNPTLKFGATDEDRVLGRSITTIKGVDLVDLWNPLFDRDFTKDVLVIDPDADLDVQFEEYMRKIDPIRRAPEASHRLASSTVQATTCPATVVDVWNFESEDSYVGADGKTHNKEVYKLSMLAYLCCQMRTVYGKKTTFMIDCEDRMAAILFGIKMTYASLMTRIELDITKADTGYLPTPEKRIGLALSSMSKASISGRMPARSAVAKESAETSWADMMTELQIDWTVRSCDASYMDSAEREAPLHAKETGAVFHEKSMAQVRLHGATDDGLGNRSYKYDLWSKASQLRKNCDDHSETRVAKTDGKEDADGRTIWKYDEPSALKGRRVHHDRRTVFGEVSGRVGSNDPRWNNVATPLALKRAGDWGMIKHCRDNGMVFVTPDRFAQLFASFSDAASMFLRVQDVKCSVHVHQYSWSLVASDHARTNLKHYPDPQPANSHFKGGSNAGALKIEHAILSVIVFACSLLGTWS
jgi:hypothetical protein